MKPTVYIAFLLLLLVGMERSVIYVYYEVNKEYITEKYCENKDKPMLHCNGKCHLSKMMKEKQEPAEKESPAIPLEQLIKNFEFVGTLKESYLKGEVSDDSRLHGLLFVYYREKLHSLEFVTSIFHPPRA